MSLSLFHGVQDELYDSLNFSPQLQRRLTELIFFLVALTVLCFEL